MFKKIPLSLAVLALQTQAVRIESIPACDSYDGCKTKTAAAPVFAQKKSIPACNSFSCQNETAAKGVDYDIYQYGHQVTYDQPWVPAERFKALGYAQKQSRPACTTDSTYGMPKETDGCKRDTAAAEYAQKESIPACDSYDGCKTKTAAAPLMQVSNPGNKWQCDQDPSCRRYMNEPTATGTWNQAQKSLIQRQSIPDCNSFDCRTGTAAADLVQKKSIPDCNSFDCRTKTVGIEESWIPNGPRFSLSQSIPDCNSFDCRTKTVGIEESWIPNGPRFSLAEMKKESIPACDSYDGCKTKTAAAPLMQVSNPGNKWQCDQDPSCRRYMNEPTATGTWNQAQKNSIPACTSVECKTRDQSQIIREGGLAQQKSIPACTSFECKNKDQSQNQGILINAQTGKGDWGLVQLNSDPICPSSGCEERTIKGRPMNYFVPNFGTDSDILAAQQSEKDAIIKLKGKDALPAEAVKEEDAESPAEKAAIIEMKAKSAKAQDKEASADKKTNEAPVEAPAADAKPPAEAKIQLSQYWSMQDKLAYYMNVETGVDLRSDPNCNSVECLTGHSFPYDETKKPVMYKDTTGQEFLDEDIKSTQAHLGMTETKLGKWTWNEKKDDDLLNWMPAVNAEAEEKPKAKNATKAAPVKEAAKVEAKPAAEAAPKAEAAALQMESEGMKKPVKKAKKVTKKASKPVETKKITKTKGKSHNKANRQTDNKDWSQHRYHFTHNYKGYPQKRKGRNSARNTMMNNWNTNTYAQEDI